jgi:hypothetical protein
LSDLNKRYDRNQTGIDYQENKMIRTKSVETTKLVAEEVRCNMCGKSIPETPGISGQFEFARLIADWGYGSNHDTEHFEVQICEPCVYETLLPNFEIQPEVTEGIW